MTVLGDTLRTTAELMVKLADLADQVEHEAPPLTVSEYAHLMRIHTATVHRQIARGEINAFKVGAHWRIRPSVPLGDSES